MEKYLWTAHVEKIDLERDATVEREDVNKNTVAEEAEGARTLPTSGRLLNQQLPSAHPIQLQRVALFHKIQNLTHSITDLFFLTHHK